MTRSSCPKHAIQDIWPRIFRSSKKTKRSFQTPKLPKLGWKNRCFSREGVFDSMSCDNAWNHWICLDWISDIKCVPLWELITFSNTTQTPPIFPNLPSISPVKTLNSGHEKAHPKVASSPRRQILPSTRDHPTMKVWPNHQTTCERPHVPPRRPWKGKWSLGVLLEGGVGKFWGWSFKGSIYYLTTSKTAQKSFLKPLM